MEALKVNHIKKSFSKKLILDDISFSLQEGEIVGFVGPNGAGKSTTLKTICNLITQEEGTIEILGIDVVKDRKKAISSIAAVIEAPGLYPYLSGMDHLKFIAQSRHRNKADIESIINTLNMRDYIKKKAGKYSMGMKQRLGLAMCLLADPKVLLLDEPTNGLDPSGVIELRNLLKRLCKEEGKTIFFSSHNLAEIEKICDKIIFIKDGKIVDIQTKTESDKDKYHLYLNDNEKGFAVLSQNEVVNLKDDCLEVVIEKTRKLGDIIKLIFDKDIDLISIRKIEEDTEEIYNTVYNHVDG